MCIRDSPDFWAFPSGSVNPYFSTEHSEWKKHVERLSYNAKRIIIMPSNSDGLNWEIGMILKNGFRNKVEIYLPIQKSEFRSDAWQYICDKFGVILTADQQHEIFERFQPVTVTLGSSNTDDKIEFKRPK